MSDLHPSNMDSSNVDPSHRPFQRRLFQYRTFNAGLSNLDPSDPDPSAAIDSFLKSFVHDTIINRIAGGFQNSKDVTCVTVIVIMIVLLPRLLCVLLLVLLSGVSIEKNGLKDKLITSMKGNNRLIQQVRTRTNESIDATKVEMIAAKRQVTIAKEEAYTARRETTTAIREAAIAKEEAIAAVQEARTKRREVAEAREQVSDLKDEIMQLRFADFEELRRIFGANLDMFVFKMQAKKFGDEVEDITDRIDNLTIDLTVQDVLDAKFAKLDLYHAKLRNIQLMVMVKAHNKFFVRLDEQLGQSGVVSELEMRTRRAKRLDLSRAIRLLEVDRSALNSKGVELTRKIEEQDVKIEELESRERALMEDSQNEVQSEVVAEPEADEPTVDHATA